MNIEMIRGEWRNSGLLVSNGCKKYFLEHPPPLRIWAGRRSSFPSCQIDFANYPRASAARPPGFGIRGGGRGPFLGNPMFWEIPPKTRTCFVITHAAGKPSAKFNWLAILTESSHSNQPLLAPKLESFLRPQDFVWWKKEGYGSWLLVAKEGSSSSSSTCEWVTPSLAHLASSERATEGPTTPLYFARRLFKKGEGGKREEGNFQAKSLSLEGKFGSGLLWAIG